MHHLVKVEFTPNSGGFSITEHWAEHWAELPVKTIPVEPSAKPDPDSFTVTPAVATEATSKTPESATPRVTGQNRG